jgi:hypothetical protein
MEMDMESINNLIPETLKQLKSRSDANKGHEYEYLWVKVSFALTRGGHMHRIGARAFGVFMVIRAYMNKDGVSFPSLKTIAKESKLSVNTIKKDVDILIAYKWIRKINKRNQKGMYETTNYQILENDLVRGTNSKSFLSNPVSRIDNGLQPEPVSKNHNGDLTTKNY